MNELLRKANELVALNVISEHGHHYDGWPCYGKYPCMYTSEVLALIAGYQDLLRRMARDLDACAIYVTENDELIIRAYSTLREVEASLPEVSE